MSDGMSKNTKIVSWVLRVLAAILFLFPVGAIPKLMGDPYAVQLFEKLGAGDAGRYGVAVMELIAAALLLIPKTAVYGGIFGALLMIGAIGSHLTKLGIVVEFNINGVVEKNPMLFGLAVLNLLLCAATVYVNRANLPIGGKTHGGAAPAAS